MNDYCGEANAQMARDGYPDPADRLLLRTSIPRQPHQSPQQHTGRATKVSGTPTRRGFDDACGRFPVPPVNWVECASTHRDDTQTFIQRCVGDAGFPTAVLTNEGRHWVLVVGWETNSDASGGHPSLEARPLLRSETGRNRGGQNRHRSRRGRASACFSVVGHQRDVG